MQDYSRSMTEEAIGWMEIVAALDKVLFDDAVCREISTQGLKGYERSLWTGRISAS